MAIADWGYTMTVTYSANSSHRDQGMSVGLCRGLVVLHDTRDITREGLGLGAVAARVGDFTYFSESTGTQTSGRTITKHFQLNQRLLWTVRGRSSPLLTRLSARSTALYMSTPLLQKSIMHVKLLSLIKRIVGFGIVFERVSPVAQARCDYAIGHRRVGVTCHVAACANEPIVLYVMNELSADIFGVATVAGRRVGLPSGWVPLSQNAETPCFSRDDDAVRFTVGGLQATPALSVRSFWGREKAPGISWAGFEYEFELARKQSDVTLRYDVAVEEAGGQS